MTVRLTELYDLEEAGPGDMDILDHYFSVETANRKLSAFPWKEIDPLNYSMMRDQDVQVWDKKIERGVQCVMFLMPRDLHHFTTGRGSGGEGHLVDLEIAVGQHGSPADQFILHVEKHFPDRSQAENYASKLRDFVDTRNVKELLQVPRSGKLSMSKVIP